jgi:hypothetical protein
LRKMLIGFATAQVLVDGVYTSALDRSTEPLERRSV